jgi:hypothetical protein
MFALYKSDSVPSNRNAMDRRRLEMAHLEYAVLYVCSWYPDDFQKSKLPFKPGSIDDTIDSVCCIYHTAFSSKYAGWLAIANCT